MVERSITKWKSLKGMLVCFVLIYFVGMSSIAQASSHLNNAKTDPPPLAFTTFGAFDPSHQYLDDGFTTIDDLGNGEIKLTATTIGTTVVDELGAQMTLQQWTGTSWVDINNGPSLSDTNLIVFDSYEYRTVDTGYYYRVVSTHWAVEGSPSLQ